MVAHFERSDLHAPELELAGPLTLTVTLTLTLTLTVTVTVTVSLTLTLTLSLSLTLILSLTLALTRFLPSSKVLMAGPKQASTWVGLGLVLGLAVGG